MEELQVEFQNAIQKFQTQLEQDLKEELSGLKQKVTQLTTENDTLKQKLDETDKYRVFYREISEALNTLLNVEEKEEKTLSPSKPDSSNPVRWPLRNRQQPPIILHSIKDRLRNMEKDPHEFTSQLPLIGKKMAQYYRKAHNNEDPSKRDEKINDKHTSPVCVYSEENWEYMDYLLKTSLELE